VLWRPNHLTFLNVQVELSKVKHVGITALRDYRFEDSWVCFLLFHLVQLVLLYLAFYFVLYLTALVEVER
jgi:hypothetical protein